MIRLREFLATPEVFLSAEVQTMRAHLRAFFFVIFFATDGAGRFRADAGQLRAVLYAVTLQQVSKQDVQAMLVELRERGFIRLYTEGGDGFGKVTEKYWQQRDRNRKAIHPEETKVSPVGELFGDAEPPRPPIPAEPLPRDASSTEWNRREKNSPQPPPEAGAGEEDSSFDIRSDIGFRTHSQLDRELFETMAALEGSPLDKLPPRSPGRTAILRAIAGIKRSNGGSVLPADLERAVAAWKKIFPEASVTAHAISKHWAKLNGPVALAQKPKPLVEEEPLGWRDFINEEFPNSVYARGNEKEGTPWHDVEAYARRHILAEMRKRGLLPPENKAA